MLLRFLHSLLVITSCLFILIPVAFADSQEWKDPAYNFSKVKKILILEPQFSYETNANPTTNKDYFKKYPNSKENINSLVSERFGKLITSKYINRSYIETQVKGDPELQLSAEITNSEFSAIVDKELYKYVDLVLSVEITDYGWNYIYHDAYDTTRTITETVRYGGKTPEGKDFSGWMEVPRTITEHHNAGFNVYDSAKAKFSLINPQTKKAVWTYSDNRDRSSSAFGNDYDPSGPESMMKRIFDSSYNKFPVIKK